MALYVDCAYCGEGLTPGSREYLRFDAVDPATSRDVRLGAARLHRECAEAVEQLLKDHVAWVRGGGAPLSWQLL